MDNVREYRTEIRAGFKPVNPCNRLSFLLPGFETERLKSVKI